MVHNETFLYKDLVKKNKIHIIYCLNRERIAPSSEQLHGLPFALCVEPHFPAALKFLTAFNSIMLSVVNQQKQETGQK